MTKLTFRDLTAEEIDCRIATVKDEGITLLLYKDARCDMNILDETVGAYNWQRTHSRDNANCTVSIWDDDKKQWISKEDTGTESNTEAEKGLASDSFKRACFNWGIGRELYTAPFIWIEKGSYKGKYDKFEVQDITIEDKKIVGLSIYNKTLKRTVFTFGKTSNKKEKAAPVATSEPAKQAAVAPLGNEAAKPISQSRLALREFIQKNNLKDREPDIIKACNIGPESTDTDYDMALFYAKSLIAGIRK
jgi:hypothetical protein